MKILLAEDDSYTRHAVEEILGAEGFTVAAAADGEEAWNEFLKGGIDLACLDIMMPLISGYEVCKKIRQAGSAIPVMFVSAKSEEIDTVLGLELGADDYITKPFGARELVARIRALIRRVELARSNPDARDGNDDSGEKFAGDTVVFTRLPAFEFGPWRVEPAELSAKSDLGRVDLSAREVGILNLLNRRRGKVVSREDFFRACWGWENAPQSRTLDQHMAVLRKKLSDSVLIETVQGLGYRVR